VLTTMPSGTPKKKPGPKPQPSRVRGAVTNIRSTQAWKEWVAEFAAEEGCDLVDLVEEAFLMLAHKKGFKMPPQR